MKTNIMKIDGEWESGLILDWHMDHSTYLGDDQSGRPQFDNVRTEVGESIYLLKYSSDLTQVSSLAETMVNAIKTTFPPLSYIVPMPPSKSRNVQPLILLAKKVAELLEIPIFENILLKNGTTPQMKDINSRQEKMEALMACFHINDEITTEGSWDVLIIDDLYSSGASLTVATQTMKTYTKAKNIYVAAFSRTKQP